MNYKVSLIVEDLFGERTLHEFKVSNVEELKQLLHFVIGFYSIKIKDIKELD